MENLPELSGYVASTLVLLTFVAKDMRLLRTVAIFSNLAFITYSTLEWLPPVLFLHMLLLPLNVVRLAEIVRGTRATGDLIQTDGVVRAQVLRADVTARGQPPVLPWSSAHRTQRAQASRSDATRPSPLEMETRHVPHDRSRGADRQAGHDSLPAGLAVVDPTPDESMISINPLAVSIFAPGVPNKHEHSLQGQRCRPTLAHCANLAGVKAVHGRAFG
jgi:hypothetical protein